MVLAVAVVAGLALTSVAADSGTTAVQRVRERTAHTRVDGGGATLILPGLRLVVPAGALPAGALVGLGAGGVPDQAGALAGTGVVVTASTPLAGAVTVVVTPDFTDEALIAGRTPALLDVARGTLTPCLADRGQFACAVRAVGAYTVRGSDSTVVGDGRAQLEAALAGPPASERPAPAALLAALWTAAAICAGGAIVMHRR